MAAPVLTGSVGIIGGADGPTAILVSGDGSTLSTLLLIAGGICAFVALVTILARRRK